MNIYKLRRELLIEELEQIGYTEDQLYEMQIEELVQIKQIEEELYLKWNH